MNYTPAIEKAIKYFDAHKGIIEKLYVKDIVEKLIEFREEETKVKNLVKPVVSGQLPPMFIRWCISKKIEVYSGDAIGITSMGDNGMFPVVSAEILFEIFMEETGGNFR